ncbi:ParB/RepB/Spo0J family partition protein [Coleofasciculus sp.]|uniref:ParB/RepB/Spo0J family partition protein n=1 Tax=Coleofasciculus sp. TaxID=3100458 RepID=UPI0040648D1F
MSINHSEIYSHQSMQPIVSQVAPSTLSPHPCNAEIYGDEAVSDLVELIRQSGWVKPLVVTTNHVIISGHRRWKAVRLLQWEAIPVEYREFMDKTAELEALLLENANRVKTVEQKVREAQAWKEIETQKARERQQQAARLTNQKLGRNTDQTLCENFRTASQGKGRTVDRLAERVGLGSGRTYEKAAKVVKAIDHQTSQGNLEAAATLRQALNSKSIHAAHQLLASLTIPSNTSHNGSDTASIQRSCWNCQHRGESIENHSFWCNRLGTLSLLTKDANTRGTECKLWSDRWNPTQGKENQNPQPKNYILTLSFDPQLRPLFEDAARHAGMSVVDWANHQLLLAACVTNLISPSRST